MKIRHSPQTREIDFSGTAGEWEAFSSAIYRALESSHAEFVPQQNISAGTYASAVNRVTITLTSDLLGAIISCDNKVMIVGPATTLQMLADNADGMGKDASPGYHFHLDSASFSEYLTPQSAWTTWSRE